MSRDDWPPTDSAWRHAEGFTKYGSTGQLWQVRNKQWVRVKDKPNREPRPASEMSPGGMRHC